MLSTGRLLFYISVLTLNTGGQIIGIKIWQIEHFLYIFLADRVGTCNNTSGVWTWRQTGQVGSSHWARHPEWNYKNIQISLFCTSSMHARISKNLKSINQTCYFYSKIRIVPGGSTGCAWILCYNVSFFNQTLDLKKLWRRHMKQSRNIEGLQ